MSTLIQRVRQGDRRALALSIIALALLSAALLGPRASQRWIALIFAALAGLTLMLELRLGLLCIIGAALVLPFEIGTGTEVRLNAVTLLVPALFAMWVFQGLGTDRRHWSASRVNRPLILFLVSSLFSLLAGNAFWDVAIPKSGHFWLVQLAQWGIFVIAAMAFWLTANMVQDEVWLQRISWAFLYLGGGLAMLRFAPGLGGWTNRFNTMAFLRIPFWMLLGSLAGGQLLFNSALARPQRYLLIGILAAAGYYALFDQQQRTSNWVGLAAVAGVLIWLRFPTWRKAIVMPALVLLASGLLFPSLYEFAGGDAKWIESGGSRLVLIERVVSVTLRNPVTGLGPASYRHYANVEPLRYQRMLWFNPQISSHNNYIDLFAHTGLLGLGLFLWFAVELTLLGLRLSQRYRTGFVGGYASGMLAAWAGSLVTMLLADWMLPFVYNIGFPGFQASLLVWLFLGGLVVLEQQAKAKSDA